MKNLAAKSDLIISLTNKSNHSSVRFLLTLIKYYEEIKIAGTNVH